MFFVVDMVFYYGGVGWIVCVVLCCCWVVCLKHCGFSMAVVFALCLYCAFWNVVLIVCDVVLCVCCIVCLSVCLFVYRVFCIVVVEYWVRSIVCCWIVLFVRCV